MSTRGKTLDEVGFVHCALPHQLAGVAERYYDDLPDEELVVLELDEDRLGAPVRHEAMVPGGERFPHVYGPIPVGAVLRAAPPVRDDRGRVVPPG
jgi:uncharacterized protein (DUF952 family)